MFLFSYGAITPQDLAEKIGFAGEPHQAYIKGYEMLFRGPRALATLVKKEGTVTYGYVVPLIKSDILALEDWEAPGEYRMKQVTVEANFGAGFTETKGITFVSVHPDKNKTTTIEYLKKVVANVTQFWRSPTGGELTFEQLKRNPRLKAKKRKNPPQRLYYTDEEVEKWMEHWDAVGDNFVENIFKGDDWRQGDHPNYHFAMFLIDYIDYMDDEHEDPNGIRKRHLEKTIIQQNPRKRLAKHCLKRKPKKAAKNPKFEELFE